MIQTKKVMLVMFLAFCLMCMLSLDANIQTLEAGNVIHKAVNKTKSSDKHPPITITVFNNAKSGIKATLIWSSKNQPGGVCHIKEILPDQKASYTFTKNQLKGEIEIKAIVQPESEKSEKAHICIFIATISDKNHSVTVPLSNIVRDGFGYYSGYVTKEQLQQLIPKSL